MTIRLQKRIRFVSLLSFMAVTTAFFAVSVLPTMKITHAMGQVYLVTNTGDNNGTNPAPNAGTGTLRQAIVDANANATLLNSEPHNIQFNIPGTGVQTINLQAALPQITQPTIIDGTTQAGSSCGQLVPTYPATTNTPHTLNIEITDAATPSHTHQFILKLAATATGSVIKGIAITSDPAKSDGAIRTVAPSTTITCNYIGTRADGTTILAQQGVGVQAYSTADNLTVTNTVVVSAAKSISVEGGTSKYISGVTLKSNIIGLDVTMKHVPYPQDHAVQLWFTNNVQLGGTLAEGNIIGGSTNPNRGAIYIGSWSLDADYSNVVIQGNYVGIAPDGTAIPNAIGVSIDSTAHNVLIGGDQATQRNVVAGNSGYGIIANPNASSDITVNGNYVGLQPDGITAQPNGTGIWIKSGQFSIGDGTATGRNVISGNTSDAINISGTLSAMSYVKGNYIGLDKNGHSAANGGTGFKSSVDNITVGGSTAGEGNYFGKNGQAIDWDGSTGNSRFVYGNQIGFEADGETAAKNTTDTTILIGGTSPMQFGGPNVGEGNLIGNVHGSAITTCVSGIRVQGNSFGLTKSGQPAPITWAGMWVCNNPQNMLIGGDTPAEGNTFAHTGDYALDFVGAPTNVTIKNNDIHHNTQDFGQPAGGIYLGSGSNGNIVTNNKIHDLSNEGVVVLGTNNLIRQNSIYNNVSTTDPTKNLGIDLGNDGVTPNDLLDPDTGPNNLQNYPVITASMTKCDGTTDTKNTPMFNSTPNTTFTIDYYANPSWDPNGTAPRQGEQWVNSETVTTDAQGNANLNLSLINSMTYPSVTATDPNGNTSEFGSINTMAFTQCQDMVQRVVATTAARDFSLGATWTGFTVPNTYYGNWPTWDGTQYVDNIQKSGLTFKVTVGGQDFIPTEPLTQWNSAYNLDNGSWNTNGHTATPLPEGTYDVVLTVTDPLSGLSMTKTYKNAVKVALPKVNYTTTFTNNSTPTLTGTASGVSGLYSAYILPKGSPVPNPSLNPGDPGYVIPRVLQYVPDTTTDVRGGTVYLDTGSFKVITNKQTIIDAWTTSHDLQLANWATGGSPSGWYFWDWVGWWLKNVPGTDWTTVKTVDQLKATCTNPAVPQVLMNNWGDPGVDTQAGCEAFFQQHYDTNKAWFDQDLQNRIDALNATPASCDTTPLVQGTYDVYFLGNDVNYATFQKDFPGGLVVDFTTPTATLVTTSAKDTVSPELNGSVSDPTATVVITLTGKDKNGNDTTYGPYTAKNNADGTWTLPAGTITPGLVLGTYSVKVAVTSLTGNTSTDTKTLAITATPLPPTTPTTPTTPTAPTTPTIPTTVATTINPSTVTQTILARTGVDGYAIGGIGVVLVVSGLLVTLAKRSFLRRRIHYRAR